MEDPFESNSINAQIFSILSIYEQIIETLELGLQAKLYSIFISFLMVVCIKLLYRMERDQPLSR
jgi:hypothetical protein